MEIDLKYRNLEVRRVSFAGTPVDINNNSTIISVNETEGILEIGFLFTSNYEPNVGTIRIEGEISVKDTKENIKSAISEWRKSKNKNLPEAFAEKVHNAILTNCIVEATVLSREVRLPAPIPIPRISINKKEGKDKDKITSEVSSKNNSDINSYIR